MELDALERPTTEALRARYLALLALAVVTGDEGSLDEARQTFDALGVEEDRAGLTSRLASAQIAAGRLARADAVAEFGIQALESRDPNGLPLLRRVRAEAARLRGDWKGALDQLERMQIALAAAPALNDEQERWYRGLIDLGHAQIWLELGRLDRCAALLAAAKGAASEDQSFAAWTSVELDLALMRESPQHVLQRLAKLRAEERVGSNGLALAAALAHLESARQARLEGKEPKAHLDAARAEVGAALAADATLPEQFNARLASCEIEILAGETARAVEALMAAEDVGAKLTTGSEVYLRELLLLPTLRWELARLGGRPLEPLRDEVMRTFEELLEQWQNVPLDPSGIGFLELSWRTQVVGAAIEAAASAGGDDAAEHAFAVVLRAQAQGTGARTAGAAADLGGVREKLLTDERGAIVLLPGHFRSHLFLVDAKQVRHIPLASSRDELRSLARSVRREISDVEKVRDDLARLTAALLPDEARVLLEGWDEVYSIGFELSDLPFGMLVDRNGGFLGARVAYSTLPSLVRGVMLEDEPRTDMSGALELALIIAQEPGDPSLSRLPFAAKERKRLVHPFARFEVLERATLAATREALRKPAFVTHFVAHGGNVDDGSPALVLCADGEGTPFKLGPSDVGELRVGPLVLLSACSPGRGAALLGDDRPTSLGGAFLDVGARSVVLARFQVEFHATLALMEDVEKRVASGASPARALRDARAALARDPRAAFHAAAFEVLGLGHAGVLEKR